MPETLFRFVVDFTVDTDDPKATGWAILESLDHHLDNLGDHIVEGSGDYVSVQSDPKGFKVLVAADD